MTKIIGDEALRRKLNRLADMKFLRPVMKAAGIHIRGKAKIYPEPPPQSTYRRTGVLRKGWTSKTWRSGKGVTIGNKVPYGPWVQDPVLQAWMHAGRWKTTDDIAEDEQDEVLKMVQRAVDKELARV